MWKGISLLFLSTWKFMFAPLAGPVSGFSFWETLAICLTGGYLSATVFYFGSTFFMNLTRKHKLARRKKAEEKGKKISPQKNFTRTNKLIIKIKNKLDRYAIYWIFPLFFSIPLGSIVVAKFYKHHKETFLFIILFLTLDAFFITGLTYLLKG